MLLSNWRQLPTDEAPLTTSRSPMMPPRSNLCSPSEQPGAGHGGERAYSGPAAIADPQERIGAKLFVTRLLRP
jgi:hypothetical protein